jgi:hypothetical protein
MICFLLSWRSLIRRQLGGKQPPSALFASFARGVRLWRHLGGSPSELEFGNRVGSRIALQGGVAIHP